MQYVIGVSIFVAWLFSVALRCYSTFVYGAVSSPPSPKLNYYRGQAIAWPRCAFGGSGSQALATGSDVTEGGSMDAVGDMSPEETRRHQELIAKNRGLTVEEYLERYRNGEFGQFGKPKEATEEKDV